MNRCSILLAGVGNTLLRDEGVGLHAVKRLQEIDLPDEISLVRCDTDLLSMDAALAGQRRIIIVDAIQAGGEPGAIHVIREHEFDKAEIKSTSAHQMSAIESALLLKEIHPELSNTELIFVGVEPSDMSVGEKLSPRVEAAMPRLIEKILGLLRE